MASIEELEVYIKNNIQVRKFFKAYTATDVENLVEKAYMIYIKALKIHNYRCLETFKFLAPRIIHNPFYADILQTGSKKKILDIGCALGTDLRKMYLDGMLQHNLYGLELEQRFIDLGYELFADRQKNKITFLIGNILDETIVKAFNSMNQFDIVYSSSVIHLLEKEEIKQLLKNVLTLLEERGIFFGQTTGLKEPQEQFKPSGQKIYLHSKKSLQQELKNAGFKNIKIEVKDHDHYTENNNHSHDSHRYMLFFYCES